MKLVKGFINRIRTSDYTKSLLVLTGGTFIAQLIPIIFYPIIGRLFTPDQIGTAAIFSQIAAILAILVTGGYTYSIFISKSKEEAFNIIVLVLSLSIFVLSVICLTFYFLRDEIHLLLNEPLFVKLFFIPILIALFIVIYQCYNEWCVKNKYFPDEMIAKAISLGVSKININTECQLVFAEATRKYIEAGKDQQGKGFDPRKLLAPGSQAIIDKCKEKIELFGCAGKG